MARDDLYFRLRISADLKDRVKAAAAANHRSITAEIVAALEAMFPEVSHLETPAAARVSLVAEVMGDIDKLKAKLQRIHSIGESTTE